MRLREISFIPVAHIEASIEEIELLIRIAESHYDARCIDAGKVGGFLFGMRNFSDSGLPHALSKPQIDTMLKVLEMANYHCNGDDAVMAKSIEESLYGAIDIIDKNYVVAREF